LNTVVGHDKYFTSNPAHGDYYFIDISFSKVLETISHELAHKGGVERVVIVGLVMLERKEKEEDF
jgi:hypothetical protein